MKNNKIRKNSGYYTPQLVISKKQLIQEHLFVNPVYNEWLNYRDGFRNWFRDNKLIKKIERLRFRYFDFFEKTIIMNKKQKKLLNRRKLKKSEINLFFY